MAVASGGWHTCGLTQGGAVRCWGWNNYGQIGDGTPTWRLSPVAVVGLGAAAAIATGGGDHTCVITTGGSAWCWGQNGQGQLGNGTTTNRTLPAIVTSPITGWDAIEAGTTHTCAVTTLGGARCWGWNNTGQLGDGTTTTSSTPVTVSGLGSGVTAITAGHAHSCAITSAGALWCWGSNGYGQLGDGTTTDRLTPVAVSGLDRGVVAVSAGYGHTCAVTGAGAVLCWGWNNYGQLGDGTTTDRLTPTAVSGLGSGGEDVTAGGFHTCALAASGAMSCWGSNMYGQVGDGTTVQRATPAAVTGLGSEVAGITAGLYQTCARTDAGSALCWGRNDHGQVGDGTTTWRYAPVGVTGLQSGVTAIAAGGYHACAIAARGAVHCWGWNDYGQLGEGMPAEWHTPVPTVGLQPWPSDVNRDGRSDVVWRHATGGDLWVWPMADGAPAGQTYVGTVPDTGWQIKGLGDQTGDGRADLLWRHQTSGGLFLWTMNGTTITAQSYLGVVVPDYAIVGTADYTGDGKTDILWRHQASGALWLWRMNGATLEAVTQVATIAPAYAVVASGDVNADGKADILWRHTTAGDVWVWLMNGAVATSQVYLGAVTDLGFQVAGLADHDRDGRADVLWHHATSGDVWLWRMDGAAIAAITHVATVGDANFHVAGVGDYDGDGRADVLWHHATTGAVWVWLMNGGSITSATQVATVPDVGYQIVNPM